MKVFTTDMRCLVMFITAVCLIFLNNCLEFSQPLISGYAYTENVFYCLIIVEHWLESRDISSYPIKETVKSPGDFSFRQLSRVLQEWRRAIFIRFPHGSYPMRVQAQQFKIPFTNRSMTSSNRLNGPRNASPACSLSKPANQPSLSFACTPKNNRMDVYEIYKNRV